MPRHYVIIILILINLFFTKITFAKEYSALLINELKTLSLEELMQVTVQAASGIAETLRQAPAAMVVISEQDIIEHGYSSLDEVLQDLPGFDTIVGGGFEQITAYQRGYRTPFTQRILFMINGLVENHLYSQSAIIGRQYPLSNIERIEVLYGPSSAVYGANAFSGVINVITKNPQELKDNEHHLELNTQLGSFDSKTLELSALGRQDKFSYNISARIFHSDEPSLDDFPKRWGFTSDKFLKDKNIWGGLLQEQQHDVKFGEYYDPSRDWGILAEVKYSNFTAGMMAWETQESYGPYYAADRVQPNTFWNNRSQQYYLRHDVQATPKLHINSLALYRENRIWGGWTEAIPDWDDGKSQYSYLSFSQWNSQNSSYLFSQDYDYTWNKQFRLTGGIKYQTKRLTDAFDICSYWSEAFCSNQVADADGPYGLGAGIFHSTDPTALLQPYPLDTIPDEDLVNVSDLGTYIQGIWATDTWRFNVGLRYDHNSRYGSVTTPRTSAIYQYSPNTTFKLLYGEAFQEPAQIQLGGGWSGRIANPDLRPERAQNLEFIFMHQTERWLHDISIYKAHYSNVIKEESENAGNRDVYGLEYRGRYEFSNFLFKDAPKIHGYGYYTYTHVDSSIHYDQVTKKWVAGTDGLGDIAPHKFNLGITIPYNKKLFLDLRANILSSRDLYLRNPLRTEGQRADGYALFHLNIGYRSKQYSLSFKINNLFNEGYLQPGLEQADSGDDFTQRSLGFRNSLVSGVGRNYKFSFSYKFK